MKNQARVVVVGGGIYGVSIAYHLARLGWTDLILLEKDEIASGATAHAAGLVTQFATSETMMKFRKYSIELYSELGLFNHVGSLRVASSQGQLASCLQPGPVQGTAAQCQQGQGHRHAG
ncbi:MAG: FAD-dependent oxidoreductase [Anaerolineales bacterium]